MEGSERIDCIAPRLLGPVPSTLADALGAAGPFPHLEWLVAHAGHEPASGEDTESLLAAVHTGLPAPGPLVARGQHLDIPGICYRAAPVHLRPDRDRLLLFAGEGLAPAVDDAMQLVESFNEAFGEDGLTLWSDGTDWLLFADTAPGPDLPPLGRVAGFYLDTVLPDAREARRWRQLLNAMQMFLHDHPVNGRREANGELPVNGLWFWGGGTSAAATVGAGQRVIGDDPLSRGLASLGETVAEGIEGGVGTLGDPQAPVTLVWPDAEAALIGGDAEGWMSAVQHFESGIAPALVERVRAGGATLYLYAGNGERLTLGPRSRWRFWRRSRPLSTQVTRTG